MKDPTRALFIAQEIFPFLAEETPTRVLNRRLPELFAANGWETRTFMPKFGEINERRNQLHEVIRLSGMNVIIDDTDHPLLLKVASIQAARIQIYFIDNDDYFHRRRGVMDENGVEYTDNDERTIFYARGVIETIKKLRWTPNVIQCSGWMSALAPLYIKKAYADTPFFKDSKVIFCLTDESMNRAFPENFAKKLLIEGVKMEDVKQLRDKRVTYTDLMHLAIDHADAIIQSCPRIPAAMEDYVKATGKPFLPYPGEDPVAYLNFHKQLLAE